jgi:mxaK protein
MIKRRYFNIGLIIMMLVTTFTMSISAFSLIQKCKINEHITILNQSEYIEASRVDLDQSEVLLAYAAMQARFQLYDQAIESYSRAERLVDDNELAAIYYNIGNIHLKQAIESGQNADVDKAIAMADVGKEYFRLALQMEPTFWNAKYNYEAAQRLSRDLPLGELVEREQSEEGSAELWSAVPGFPIGLP